MGLTVGEVNAKLGFDSSSFNIGMKKAEGDFESFGSRLAGKAAHIGKDLAVGLAAGVTTALVGGTMAFADYEKGLASVSKTTGLVNSASQGTGTELKALGNELRALAIEGPVTVGELEKIAGVAGSLGIGVSKMANGDIAGARAEIISFTKVVSDMSIAFEMDTEKVASSMAGIANVYDVPIEGLNKLGSTINVLENQMKATAPGIIDFMDGFGGIATLFDVPAEKAAAFGATLAELNINGTEGATQIKSGVLQLTQAVNVSEAKIKDFAKSSGISIEEANKMFASGQENIVALAGIMGISVDDLKNQLNTDLTGTLVKAGAAFGNLQGGTEKAAQAQKIFGSYGFSALVKLGEGADIYGKALQYVAGVQGTEMTQEATTMANTISGQWQRMTNGINDVGISIGEMTSGPLYAFMDFMNNSAIPGVKSFIEAFISGDLSKFEDSINKIKEAISTAFQIGGEGLGFAVITAGFAIMASGVLKTLSGMTTKSTALWLKQKLLAISTAATTSAGVLLNYTKMAGATAIQMAKMSTCVITSFAGMVLESIASTGSMAIGVLGHYTKMAIGAAGSIATIVATTIGGFISIASSVAAPIALIIGGLALLGVSLNPSKFTNFGKIASDAFNGIKTVVTDCWALIQAGDFSGVANRLKQALMDAYNYVKTSIDWEALGSEFMTAVGDGAKAIVTEVLDIGGWIFDSVNTWITSGGPATLGQDIGNMLINGIRALLGSNKDGSLWESIKSGLGTAQAWSSLGWDIAKGIGEGLYSTIQPYINEVYNATLDFVKNSGGALLGWKVTVANSILGVFADIRTSILNTKTDFGIFYDKITAPWALQDAWNDLKNVLYYIDKYISRIKDFDLSKLIDLKSALAGAGFGEGESKDPRVNPDAANPTYRTQGVSTTKRRSYTPDAIYYSKSSSVWRSGNELNSGTNIKDWVRVSGEYSKQVISESQEIATQVSTGTTQTVGAIQTTNDIGQQLLVAYLNPRTGKTEMVYPEVKKWYELIDKQYKSTEALDKTLDEGTKNEKDASKEAVKSTNINADTVKKALSNAVDKQISGMNEISDILSNDLTFAGNKLVDAARLTNNTLVGGSQVAANALQMGSQVASSFLTGAGNAVQIGLTAQGKEIAIIGQVAQKQWTDGGNILYNKVITASDALKTSGEASGKSLEIGATTASNTAITTANTISTIDKTTANTINVDTLTTAKTFNSWVIKSATEMATTVSTASRNLANALVSVNYGDGYSTRGNYQTQNMNILDIPNPISTTRTTTNTGTTTQRTGFFDDPWMNTPTGGLASTRTKASTTDTTKLQSTIDNQVSANKKNMLQEMYAADNIANSFNKDCSKLDSCTNSVIFKTTTANNGVVSGLTFAAQNSLALQMQEEQVKSINSKANAQLQLDTTKTSTNSWIYATTQNALTSNLASSNLKNSLLIASDYSKNNNLAINAKSTKAWETINANNLADSTKINAGTKTTATNFGNSVIDSAKGFGAIIGTYTAAAFGTRTTNGGGGNSGSNGGNYTDCLFGEFTDTCTGVMVNGLRYTNPLGYTYNINPLTYHDNGGIANYQGGNSGGGSTYSLPPIFAAKGADLTSPTAIIAGENGDELVLPAPLTKMFKGIARSYDSDIRINRASNIQPIEKSSIGDITNNFRIEAVLNIDGKQFVRQVMPTVVSELKRNGVKNK